MFKVLRRNTISAVTLPKRGLEEFVDRTILESKPLESAGRAWKTQELKLKSFEDLHKLYVILVKERNALSTAKRLAKVMGGRVKHEERIQKVEKTMMRIRSVLRQRHTAAHDAARKEFIEKRDANKYHWPPQDTAEGREIIARIQAQLSAQDLPSIEEAKQ